MKKRASERASFNAWLWFGAALLGWLTDKPALAMVGFAVALLFSIVELIAQAIETRPGRVITIRRFD